MASCRFRIPLRRHTAAQPGRAPPLPEIMPTLQRPALRRTAATQPIRASFFDDSNDARNSPEAMQLREKLTTSYSNTPFRGPAFQLPSGAVVVEDMWAASLNTTIDEILDKGLEDHLWPDKNTPTPNPYPPLPNPITAGGPYR